MDFKELAYKLKSIQEGDEMFNPFKTDEPVDECGGDMPPQPAQSSGDVNMNITINGHGADGIRDLMNIIKGIEGNDNGGDLHSQPSPAMPKPHGKELFGGDEKSSTVVIGDEYENSVKGGSDAHTYNVRSVLPKGDDLASKDSEDSKNLKVNGGENPIGMRKHQHNESLLRHLSSLYEEIKSRN